MLAVLFSMQAFGFAAATITSIVVVSVVRHYHPDPSQVSVDQIWRWVSLFLRNLQYRQAVLGIFALDESVSRLANLTRQSSSVHRETFDLVLEPC